MEKNIVVIHGDGIGPEIVGEALGVLDAVAGKFGHKFNYQEAPMGGNAIDRFGVPLPEESLKTCLASDGVLLGAVGGPKWDAHPPENRPEKGLLKLRNGLGVYANLRPARMFSALSAVCPLRKDIAERGIDFIVVRELIGGVYFGEHRTETRDDEKIATDVMSYSEHEIRRIAHVAFQAARGRRKRVTSVDKANVLTTSRLWREVMESVAKEYPDVELNHLYVDNAAMQLVKDPGQFDVIVTENMFGDILSDEASQITGSIGMIPSASLGEAGKPGLYEPIHGSAPDIAGQDRANPIGTILAAAFLLRYSLGMESEARAIETAVSIVLDEGWRTGDIADIATERNHIVGCREMGRLIRERI
ncbi:MAG: 3-isopropylmalate dehydrogenase [Synergistaceae bacterium]|nr:3-isopropylmalate dehydrogenase [Synergistaceae bacterium]